MEIIRCSNVSLGYDGHSIAEGISFNVCEGDYLCIIGENGSGKSTLMKTILGLIRPLAGEITYSGGFKSTDIGYLPQQTDIQKDFPACVKEIVLSGCRAGLGRRPFYSKTDKERALSNMERTDVLQFKDKSFRELSGGQQQRVLLRRALCAAKKCILLDEPVTGLDPKATQEMYSTIKSLNEEGITIIMISHDIDAAVRYADHILEMGSDFFYGKKEEFLSSPSGKIFTIRKGGENI